MPHIAAQWEGDLQRSTSWPYTGIHPHKSLLLTSDCRDATDQSWLDWFAHFLRLCREDAGYSVALRENHCLFSAYNVNDEPVVPIVMQWIQWNQYCTNNPGLWNLALIIFLSPSYIYLKQPPGHCYIRSKGKGDQAFQVPGVLSMEGHSWSLDQYVLHNS